MLHYLSSRRIVGSPGRHANMFCLVTSHRSQSFAQRRYIISYLREIFGGGNDATSANENPFVEIIDQRRKCTIVGGKSPDSATPSILLPKFSSMKSMHLAGAADYVRGQQVQDLQCAADLLSSKDMSKATDGKLVYEPSLDYLIRSIDGIQQSHFALCQIGSLLWTLSCSEAKTKDEWHRSLTEAQSICIESSLLSPQASRNEGGSLELQWAQLHKAVFIALQSPELENSKQSNVYAANFLLKQYENATGILFRPGLSTAIDEKDLGFSEKDRVRTYSEVSEMLSEIEKSILEVDSPKVSLPTVSLFYNYIGVRTQMAKLLDYSSVVDQVFHCRQHVSTMADFTMIKQLHSNVKERLTPLLNSISERRKRPLHLETYLTGAGELTSQANLQNSKYSIQFWKDNKEMLKLEHHVTLKGALQFTFRLIKDLFGVSVAEHSKDDLDVWNENVRLYHVYDELNQNEYLGSFYLDPFQRRGKMSQPATIPMFPRGEREHQCPLVCMSLALELPPWDTSPAMMTWLDCETLLHEMGHVLQFILSRAKAGCLLGPQNLPLDISELIPKFMELWLTQKSTLFALIDMSESITPLSDESIDALYRVKSREKMLKLAELTFYGSLELELFSDFDLKGSETMLDLQGRIFEDVMVHIDNEKNNLTALLDIMQENAHGRQAAFYRYLWCEVVAAEIFDRFMELLASDSQRFPQFRLGMRRLLLEPGAAIDLEGFRAEFGFSGCTLDPLWKLHGIANALFVAPSET